MIISFVALSLTLAQDPQWAAETHAAARAANIPMRSSLTEAQREACGETIERLGAEELMRAQRQKIRDGFQQITDRARLEQPTTTEGQEWKAAFLELARMMDEQASQEAVESRRLSHALMSVNLAVCQP